MEIRLHGRGGQGGVTCAKILAAIYARLGRDVQTFGDYAGERSGAPVRAYTRVSDQPIINRNKVYEPDHLVVLDPSLLGHDVIAGLKHDGTLLVNSEDSPESFDTDFRAFKLAVVDATGIARKHGIGTRSVVIVNTTIAGAFAKLHDLSLNDLKAAYESLGLGSNFAAAKDAYEAVQILSADPAAREAVDAVRAAEAAAAENSVSQKQTILPLTEHTESLPTGLQTGSWTARKPQYVQNLAPCNAWCPAGNDVVGFIQAVAQENGEENAAKILGRSTPFAAICGRVCPAPCMEGCNRREYDGALNIRGLERWIAAKAPVAVKPEDVVPKPDAKRFAIVGGGPAGVSAAYALAKSGHKAVIFEGEEKLGGVLLTGIPEYRLPRVELEREINAVLALGVEAKCGEWLDSDRLKELASDYDGLILATGLQKLRALEVPGAELEGLEQGIRFLHRSNIEGNVKLSGHVVVLGGGNTAMDCARSALRLGAESVTVAYRRSHQEMPAIREEIEEAEHEGITMLMQRQPIAFHGTGGKVGAVELAVVELGEPDESGRRSPIVTSESSQLDCDYVLLALGQSTDDSRIPEDWKVEGEKVVTPNPQEHVFAAGDVATWEGTVTHAIGSGRRAADRVRSAVGEDIDIFARPEREKAVPVTDIRLDHFLTSPMTADVLEPAETRRNSLIEANHGLPDASEAHRCFSCGHCTECDTCLVYCPEGIINRRQEGYDVDYSFCKGCGICVEECPRKAIEMT
jgi:2-oxoacid:acceptor oxidoreductase gamma subunit (pyruvate/2-ketoisovalerate family)/2-oxoacid:acceptor oxidoreductase delta subunit (pyruvate/2-ketoisovalerate family)